MERFTTAQNKLILFVEEMVELPLKSIRLKTFNSYFKSSRLKKIELFEDYTKKDWSCLQEIFNKMKTISK